MNEQSNLEIAQFWTQVKGEVPQVRTFALIPEGWEGKLDEHPQDEKIFYWLNNEEWIALGAGETYGNAEVLSCACDECESERYAQQWEEEFNA